MMLFKPLGNCIGVVLFKPLGNCIDVEVTLKCRADCMGVVLSFLTCLLCVVLEIAPEPRGLAISNSLQVCVGV